MPMIPARWVGHRYTGKHELLFVKWTLNFEMGDKAGFYYIPMKYHRNLQTLIPFYIYTCFAKSFVLTYRRFLSLARTVVILKSYSGRKLEYPQKATPFQPADHKIYPFLGWPRWPNMTLSNEKQYPLKKQVSLANSSPVQGGLWEVSWGDGEGSCHTNHKQTKHTASASKTMQTQ